MTSAKDEAAGNVQRALALVTLAHQYQQGELTDINFVRLADEIIHEADSYEFVKTMATVTATLLRQVSLLMELPPDGMLQRAGGIVAEGIGEQSDGDGDEHE